MINREQVRKVALLARLELTPEEEEQFTAQLGRILEYFEQLSELDVTNVQPTTGVAHPKDDAVGWAMPTLLSRIF